MAPGLWGGDGAGRYGGCTEAVHPGFVVLDTPVLLFGQEPGPGGRLFLLLEP